MEKDIKTDVGFIICRAAWARKSTLLCSVLVPTPEYSTIIPSDSKNSPYIAIYHNEDIQYWGGGDYRAMGAREV